MKSFMKVSLAMCVLSGSLGAQVLETRTIELRHLKPIEAVKLLSPYVRSTGGGVFDVSENIAIITVRDVAENIAAMEKVLAKYDHSPATIRFVFQLIEADTGPRVSSASNMRVGVDLDTTLRSVLRFPVYRLLSQSVSTVGEFKHLEQQLATADSQWNYSLSATVGAIRLTDPDPKSGRTEPSGTVGLEIALWRKPAARAVGEGPSDHVISTGLSVPIGHTVVLGTASTRGSGLALILTVRPELVVVKP